MRANMATIESYIKESKETQLVIDATCRCNMRANMATIESYIREQGDLVSG